MSREAETRTEDDPVIGWRYWRLRNTPEGPRLAGPMAQGTPVWLPGETRAACRHHPAGCRVCGCGFYAWLSRNAVGDATPRAVWGTVALWGRVWTVDEESAMPSGCGHHAKPIELWHQDVRIVRFLEQIYGAPGQVYRYPAAAARDRFLELSAA